MTVSIASLSFLGRRVASRESTMYNVGYPGGPKESDGESDRH